jgi:GNAT superfamily N-acetyltransferase
VNADVARPRDDGTRSASVAGGRAPRRKPAEGLPRREGLAVEVGDEAARAVPDSGWPHVGWCAIEPRPAYTGLARNNHVPWEGRAEDKADEAVWAVTCIFTRVGFRKRGVGRALARAAVEFARERGARAVEAYPMVSKDVIVEELHVGTLGMFAAAGLTEVSRPTLRRVVMRLDFCEPV